MAKPTNAYEASLQCDFDDVHGARNRCNTNFDLLPHETDETPWKKYNVRSKYLQRCASKSRRRFAKDDIREQLRTEL